MDAPHIDVYCTGCYRNRTHTIVYTTETMARLSCKTCNLTSDIDTPEEFVRNCHNIMETYIAQPAEIIQLGGDSDENGYFKSDAALDKLYRNLGLNPSWWKQMCARYEWRCAKCKLRKKLTKDHIVPKSRGGRNHPSNIQPLCEGCNLAKGDRYIDYRWKEMKGE